MINQLQTKLDIKYKIEMMKQICVSMGYCVGFSSYTFGVMD
jgi:hypothetical protein